MGNELRLHGKKYISAKRGAEITKYTNDYIGQLCRAGKVDSVKIGRNWYITEKSFLRPRACMISILGGEFRVICMKLIYTTIAKFISLSEAEYNHY